MAFTLAKLRLRPIVAETAFRKAVELEPRNSWWNARLVTSLIERGQFASADQEWNRVLDRIDPDQTSIDEPIAQNIHRWVISAWLDVGEVNRAREVFDSLPRAIKSTESFTGLSLRLEDAEEAMELSDSVYAPSTPIDHRWSRPSLLGDRNASGQPLTAWYPGRVVSATKEEIEFVFATVEVQAQERRIIRVVLSARQWSDHGGWCEPAEASGYVFLARYQGGEAKIVPQPAYS